MERIYRYRMTTTSGGNLSIREANGDVWITPGARGQRRSAARGHRARARRAARSKGRAARRRSCRFIRQIRGAGGRNWGASCMRIRWRWWRSAWCTRFRIRGCSTRRGASAAQVGFAPYALPGSDALGNIVADTFARGFDCVILENHGVVTAGRTLQEAFRRFETLEFTAKTIIKARLLGGEVRFLTDEQLQLEQQRAGRAGGVRARGAGQRRERGAAPAVRVRAPRLPAAAVHQHAGQLLGARGCGVVRDHAVRGGSRDGGGRGPGAGARRPRGSGQDGRAAPPAVHASDLPPASRGQARSSTRIR